MVSRSEDRVDGILDRIRENEGRPSSKAGGKGHGGHGPSADELGLDLITDERFQNFLSPEAKVLSEANHAAEVAESRTKLGVSGEAGAKMPVLTRIAELILQIDVRAVAMQGVNGEIEDAEEDIRLTGRRRLAASLGCTVQDLQDVTDSYGEKWEELVLNERIRLGIDSTSVRDATWDRLESAVLRKLTHLVDANLVKDSMELLAIAKAANGAARGDRRLANQKSNAGGSLGVQQNFYLPGNPGNGVLPAGNLGKITLNLTPRMVKQLGTSAEHGGVERQIDRVEMLDIDSVREVVENEVDDS